MNQLNTKLITVSVSIVGVVMAFSLSLIVVATLITFLHQKKGKMNTEGSDSESLVQQTTRENLEEVIEVDVNEACITNTISIEPNVAYSTHVVHANTVPHDYDYIAP